MSTPRSLDLPTGCRTEPLATARGHFACLRHGDGSGVAVLVPGFTGSKEDFIHLLEPLARAGVEVVAIDLAGQYQSPPHAAYSLPSFADDVLAVLDSVADGRPTHLVGHSFGGLVARQAVLTRPVAAASLTLMSSGPGAAPEAQAHRLGLLAGLLASHGLEAVWAAKRALEEQEGVTETDDPVVAEFLRRRFLAHDPDSLLAMVDVLTTEPDRVAELAAVAPPTLVVFGTDDDAWPPAVQADMARRLGAAVAAVPGAGHSPAVDDPDLVAELLVQHWRAT